MNRHILSILRFLAAIMVIISHQQGRFEFLNDLPRFVVEGPRVTFYFVLSGFILAIAYGNREKIQIKSFLIKRLARIYPIYFISLLFPIFVIVMLDRLDYIDLILHLTLMQSWFSPYPLGINGPAWFLSSLMFCYFTFPILINYIKKYDINILMSFYIALLFWFVTQIIVTIMLNSNFYQGYPSLLHDLIFYFPLSHYGSFLLGALGGLVLGQDSIKGKVYGVGYKSFFTILIFIMIIVQYQDDINDILNIKLPYSSSFYAPLVLLLIGSVYFIDNWKAKNNFLKFIEFLGAISYPVYILQIPVASLVFFITEKYLLVNKFLELGIYFISLFIISSIYVKYLDRPLVDFLHNKLGSSKL